MRSLSLSAVAAAAAMLVMFGCGKEPGAPSAPAAPGAPAPAPHAKAVAETIPPYVYPAPVKGRLKLDTDNGGAFDVVDGIAYTALVGGDTVVHVVSRPIASPVLADAACPLSAARSLAKLRNANFAEVTLDAAGRARYFAGGTPFAGSMGEPTAAGWSSKLSVGGGRAAGSLMHPGTASTTSTWRCRRRRTTRSARGTRTRGASSRRRPRNPPRPQSSAYQALHAAALTKDLKAMLLALGFDAKQSLAIRGRRDRRRSRPLRRPLS